ncbi:phytanoyl-CoA dioxygenase family protein [Paenibacillus sp. FJAT-26967]|uniref:phytanoyl-CoA dioxygenase family protein n=1 Tax=Paenibacillus sp. FJAT-26967 TaxID=1729690 RepID=UPI00083804FA|nr:phytanoyl-CoA dioxygenase family protein [Paenibacillus sp. FJAT-26967]
MSENEETLLPGLEEEYSLTSRQIQKYQADGHIYLKGVCSAAETALYRKAITEIYPAFTPESYPPGEREFYGVERAFPTVMNMWEKSRKVRRFSLARRFAKIAADLMGVDRLRLYHDSAIFLEIGGGAIPWHQDSPYMLQTDPDMTMTMWMPLVDLPAELGSMRFMSGSHLLKADKHTNLLLQSYRKGLSEVHYGAMPAGDATFHSGLTLHYAAANTTNIVREVATIIYIADNLKIVEPDTEARAYHLRRIFPGMKAGDPAVSPWTPLVFDRYAELQARPDAQPERKED